MRHAPHPRATGSLPRKPAHSQDRKHERRGSIPPETAFAPTLAPPQTCAGGISIARPLSVGRGHLSAPGRVREPGNFFLTPLGGTLAILAQGIAPSYKNRTSGETWTSIAGAIA